MPTFTLTQNRVLVVHDYIVAGTGKVSFSLAPKLVIVISNKKETLLSAVGTDELI